MTDCPHCQTLAARVAELEAALKEKPKVPVSELTPFEAELLSILLKRDAVSLQALWTIMYAARPESDQPLPKTLTVLLCRLRAKLSRKGVDLRKNVSRKGCEPIYSIAPEGKAHLRSVPLS
jgi:hypothetical protein